VYSSDLELVDKLKEADEYDNTVFVFLIDNGWANGLPSKHSIAEKSLRTPIFFANPGRGIPRGRRIETVTSVMDVYPTILDYADAEKPKAAVGRSLRPVLERRETPRHRLIIGATYPHYSRTDGESPVGDVLGFYRRDDRWKMTWYLRDFTLDTVGIPEKNQPMLRADFIPHAAGDVELFDLSRDPYEQHDLSTDPALHDRIIDWKAEMRVWWESTGGEPLPNNMK